MNIIHLIYSFNPGGVEILLTQLTEHLPKGKVHSIFIAYKDGLLRERVEKTGSEIFIVGSIKKIGVNQKIKRIIREHVPVVVCCHQGITGGFIAPYCRRNHIPFIQFSHFSYNTPASEQIQKSKPLYYWIDSWSTKRSIKYASMGIGVSKDACESLWGKEYAKKNVEYVNSGIDFSHYNPSNREVGLRNKYKIPKSNIVIVNVAGYRPEKNYGFFIDVVNEILKQRKDVTFLMVGEGSERPMMEQKIEGYGIRDNCVLTGFVDNVPQLLCEVCDIFLFPSLGEGLGLALVEAQAAGLLCYYSDLVPQEAIINPSLMHPMSLLESKESWANNIIKGIDFAKEHLKNRTKAFEIAESSAFNIEKVVNNYMRIWENLLNQ